MYTRKALRFILQYFGAPWRISWAEVHQSRHWCTAISELTICQISSTSDNLSTRYLLPNFVDFVESETDTRDGQTVNDMSRGAISSVNWSHEITACVFSEHELTFTFAICYRPFVCLSSVCNARAPSGGWNFRQCFYNIWYLGHPLTPTENFTEIILREPLRRGS